MGWIPCSGNSNTKKKIKKKMKNMKVEDNLSDQIKQAPGTGTLILVWKNSHQKLDSETLLGQSCFHSISVASS
ncbi:hypothetical protein L6164_009841 [Bauhinia variegata]|uniref:Uncharacterized protein n=1 Tax=Bauhinia variegata TaxID=167791 RepID=A0ACB9PL29_BAUVA|nr:hypothetical protein L6164_009841 [Bauhinia variegata]